MLKRFSSEAVGLTKYRKKQVSLIVTSDGHQGLLMEN